MAILKNTTINDTGFVALPVGTTAERPGVVEAGHIRYNTSRQNSEIYTNTGWENVSKSDLRNNLIFEFDGRNFPRSNRRALWSQAGLNNEVETGWTAGSGSAAGFGQNGSTDENERINTTDPWGNNAIIWETRCNGTNADDGGWNGSNFAVSNTSLYRFTVWMKRTSSSSGGTFYHGTSGGGQCVRRLSDSGEECNPYFDCSGTGAYTQNQWYLHVQHMFPWNYSRTARHPETGVYTRETGRVQFANGCNVGEDAKMGSSTSSISQRVYHFYSADNTTRLHFFDPRVELCDGTQPSIQDLLDGNTHKWYDGSGSGNHAWLQNWPLWNAGGWMNFDGSNDHAIVPNINLAQNWTLECWVRHDVVSGFGFFGQGILDTSRGLHILFISGDRIRFGMYGNDTDVIGLTTATNTWYQYVFSYDHSNPTAAASKRVYRNGVELATTVVSGPTAWVNPVSDLRIGNTYGNAYGISNPANGQFAIARMYNKVLTSDEVLQNFEANRSRFGI
jgi:hypothetical protein